MNTKSTHFMEKTELDIIFEGLLIIIMECGMTVYNHKP